MKRPEELGSWSFPDHRQTSDGYDLKTIPDATPENMEWMVEKYNLLVEALVAIADHCGFEFEEDN